MRDHLREREEAIHLCLSLRDLMTPREDHGYGLTAAEVAKALGMHPKGTGVSAWTGRWNPRTKRFEGGRNIPTPGPTTDALRRFVDRNMRAWAKEIRRKPG